MKSTIKSKQGVQPVEYRQNADGSYSRKNPKGNWVKLDPQYAEHQNAIKAAKDALK